MRLTYQGLIRTVQVQLILASGSPRRLDLLRQIGIEPQSVERPDFDEATLKGELPRDYALRMAREKTCNVAARHGSDLQQKLVLGADTVVACGRRILPKAIVEDDARLCLDMLSGRAHQVFTGIAIAAEKGKIQERLVATRVKFKRLSTQEKDHYLASKEWQGKAGGYAVQGRAAAFIMALNGSYSNVVGLPLFETAQLLSGMGYSTLSNVSRKT